MKAVHSWALDCDVTIKYERTVSPSPCFVQPQKQVIQTLPEHELQGQQGPQISRVTESSCGFPQPRDPTTDAPATPRLGTGPSLTVAGIPSLPNSPKHRRPQDPRLNLEASQQHGEAKVPSLILIDICLEELIG